MKKSSIFASIMGNIIEWYDFSLFVYLAPIIAQHYFPSDNHKLNLLYTFIIFAIGFFVRPLGSIFFGHLGDRIGRAKTLQITMLFISIPAIGIALLPGYSTIGISAPIILTLFRMIQGLAIGGEIVGTIIYLTESASSHQRAFMSALANNGSNIGIIIATGLSAILAYLLPQDFFTHLGWRFTFLLGGVAGLVGVGLRNTIQESALFSSIQQTHQDKRAPLMIVLHERKKMLLHLCLLLVMTACGSYILVGYISTYLNVYLGYNLAHALQIQTLLIILTLFLIPLFSLLSDKIGRRKSLLIAVGGYLIFSLPCLYLLNSKHSWLFLLPLIVTYCIEQATIPATIVEMFPAKARYSAISISYNITMAVVGGTAPALNTWLINQFNNKLIIAYYLMAAALISGTIIFWYLPKSFGETHSLK